MIVKLPNYLLNLDSKEYIKAGSDSIRIYNIGNIIKRVYDELSKVKSIEEIESKTKRCEDTHLNWMLGKTGVSIQELYKLCKYWKSSCKKSKEELKSLWDEIYENSYYFGCVNGKKIKYINI